MTDDSLQKQLEEAVASMVCYKCDKPTDRFIRFHTLGGIIEDFECLECRQERVQAQVDAGIRPASDLLPENLPEHRTSSPFAEKIERMRGDLP